MYQKYNFVKTVKWAGDHITPLKNHPYYPINTKHLFIRFKLKVVINRVFGVKMSANILEIP